jgi:FlaA1/EpsC-like NDP-sugar epimerase
MENKQDNMGNYTKFFSMIGTSMVLMYILMYLNSYDILAHAWFSETRFFMTLIMGAVMTLVMFFFMRKMYPNERANTAIVAGSLLVLFSAVWLVRSQVTVIDVDYMEGMIPHHSIAILTSERAQIEDLRVLKLADGIIEAQVKEINEMEWLIEDIRNNGVAVTQEEADARPVPAFTGTEE